MSVTIRIGDIERTMEVVKDLDRRTIQRLAQFVFDESQRGAARHTKPGGSGDLFKSLYNRPIDRGRAVGHDLRIAKQALFVLLGTPPHKIQPRDRKALRWASGGKFHFAKFVNHPGYRGDPYLFQAGDAGLRNFSLFVDRAFNEVT